MQPWGKKKNPGEFWYLRITRYHSRSRVINRLGQLSRCQVFRTILLISTVIIVQLENYITTHCIPIIMLVIKRNIKNELHSQSHLPLLPVIYLFQLEM